MNNNETLSDLGSEHVATYSDQFKYLSAASAIIGLILLYMLPFVGPELRGIAALIGSVLTLSGVWFVSVILTTRISWNNETVQYQDWQGNDISVHWSEISDLGDKFFGKVSFIEFSGKPVCYLHPRFLTNFDSLAKKAVDTLRTTRPEIGYATATRDAVQQSNACGCAACCTIFPPHTIVNWKSANKKQSSKQANNQSDLAECPHCKNATAVVCDMRQTQLDMAAIQRMSEKLGRGPKKSNDNEKPLAEPASTELHSAA